MWRFSVGEFCAIIAGSALGAIGAVPLVVLFERALRKIYPVSVAAGLAGIMLSFTLHTCAVLAVWLVSRDDVLAFGTAEAVSFLLIWVVEAARAWHDIQGDACTEERKSGESSR